MFFEVLIVLTKVTSSTHLLQSVMEGDKENDGQQPSIMTTPTQAGVPTTNIGSASRYTSIRPLTAAYKAASSENEVSLKVHNN